MAKTNLPRCGMCSAIDISIDNGKRAETWLRREVDSELYDIFINRYKENITNGVYCFSCKPSVSDKIYSSAQVSENKQS